MPKTRISKVRFKKSDSSLEYATEEYLIDTLKLLSAKSQLPIKKILTILYEDQVDTISCSNDATNFHFFARARKDKVAIIVKQLGEQTMEFYLPKKKIKEYTIQSSIC